MRSENQLAESLSVLSAHWRKASSEHIKLPGVNRSSPRYRQFRNKVVGAFTHRPESLPLRTPIYDTAKDGETQPLQLPSFLDLGQEPLPKSSGAAAATEVKTSRDETARFRDRRWSVVEFHLTPYSWLEVKWCQPMYRGTIRYSR